MGTCRECKSWDREWLEDYGHGICMRGESRGSKAVDSTATAWAIDGECSHAQIYTRPEHGCVMFEAKTDA